MHYFEHSYYIGILMIIVGIIMRYGTRERPNSLGYRNTIRNRFIELT